MTYDATRPAPDTEPDTAHEVTHVIYLADRAGTHVLGGVERQLFSVLPLLSSSICRARIRVHLIVLVLHRGARVDAAIAQLKLAASAVGGDLTITTITRGTFTGWISKLSASFAAFITLLHVLATRRHHVFNLHLDHGYLPILMLVLRCPRVIFSFHNDEPFYRSALFRVWFRMLRFAGWRFTALSEHVAQFVTCHLSIPYKQIITIPYGVAPYEIVPHGFQPSSSSNIIIDCIADDHVRRESKSSTLTLPAHVPIVGFVGRFCPQKNILMLLDVIAQLPQVHLALVGGGPLRGEIERRIKELGLDNATVHEAVPNGRAVMKQFSLLCMPSQWEGLGLVLLEAMAEGIPVIGADRGAIPEVLDHGRVGLLFYDVNSCVAAIRAVLQDSVTTAERVAQAQLWITERYSLDRAVAAWADMYTSFLQPRSAATEG